LCRLYELLRRLDQSSFPFISSAEIGKRLHVKAHTVRKDINLIGEVGPSRSGYPANTLFELIETRLQLHKKRGVCVVGLGTVGQTLLRFHDVLDDQLPMLAGFDHNINRLETIKTNVPLYPFHEMTEVVQARGISLAILTTAADLAQKAADQLVGAGIRGIINLTGLAIGSSQREVFIHSIDLLEELRILAACIAEENSGRLK
jgi:redox-sensing transcriptional repressor